MPVLARACLCMDSCNALQDPNAALSLATKRRGFRSGSMWKVNLGEPKRISGCLSSSLGSVTYKRIGCIPREARYPHYEHYVASRHAGRTSSSSILTPESNDKCPGFLNPRSYNVHAGCASYSSACFRLRCLSESTLQPACFFSYSCIVEIHISSKLPLSCLALADPFPASWMRQILAACSASKQAHLHCQTFPDDSEPR